MFFAVIAAAAALPALAVDPGWWLARGVTQANLTKDDYALLNAGQLRNLAYKGYLEMDAKLPPGTVGPLRVTITKWLNPANPAALENYMTVNNGALKNTAAPFLERLISLGYRDLPLAIDTSSRPALPWVAAPAGPADDYAYANIGAAKRLFSFDFTLNNDADSMPNWWEWFWNIRHPGGSQFVATVADGGGDFDGDGWSNATEFALGTDPFVKDKGTGWDADDYDGDGWTNGAELTAGTDYRRVDTDGDGYWDNIDAAPTNSAVWLPAANPSDVTPPLLTLISPAGVPFQ